ncbi:hypothetical protein [Palleronia abyssalis]|uniref:Uncharacterized protein n=1 Tax=Palleronia abyssalis TaxID=1501240 RepID=A0A2R8C267_9RHOB|nr:hypothetical protein [Palleronia abyssalis]SPJ26507.1 hypothetical protein PAA8504_04372 [Palleronia abyssalis]
MDRTPASNQPIETLRDGRLKATLWENQGESGPYHTVTLAKVYEDKDGHLQETSSFSARELLRVAELAREAHGLIRSLRREHNLERTNEREAPKREERPHRPRRAAPDRFAGREGPSLDR